MKKIMALLLTLVMVLSLAACASSGSQGQSNSAQNSGQSAGGSSGGGAAVSGKSSHKEDGTDPIQLAFVLYDWSDDQGTYLESYLNYLADNMNITVECVSYSNSGEDVINVVESLCSKGVDGIAVATNDAFQSWAQICEDNEVYCSIMLGCLNDEDDREFAKGLNYYLGSVGTYDYGFLGEAYADFIIDSGYQNVLIAGPSQGLQDQSDQMVAGAVPVLEAADINYELIQTEFKDLFSSVAAATASASYDVIFTPLGVMSFGLPQIFANNLVGKTVAMGHGTDESMADAINAGTIAMFSDNLTTSVGVNVAMMVNCVEGNQYPDYPAGAANNIQSPSFVVQSPEDFALYSQYVRNFENPIYYLNVDLVQDMIVSYNAGATYSGVKTFIEGLDISNLADNAG